MSVRDGEHTTLFCKAFSGNLADFQEATSKVNARIRELEHPAS